jgi:hypothetical protein
MDCVVKISLPVNQKIDETGELITITKRIVQLTRDIRIRRELTAYFILFVEEINQLQT